jgi:hypothetical protein
VSPPVLRAGQPGGGGRLLAEPVFIFSAPFERGMLEYGRFEHAGFTPGLGDSSLNIRSGRIQPPTPVPDEIPAELAGICASWGYLVRV